MTLTGGAVRLGPMVRVPKAMIPSHRLVEIEAALVLTPQVPAKFGFDKVEHPVVVMFKDMGDAIEVPRQYALEEMGDVVNPDLMEDDTSDGQPVAFAWVGDEEHKRRASSKGEPGWAEKQNVWVEKLHGALIASRVHGAIGEAPTAFGKTVCMMKLIALLGRTTLVVVHKDDILNQWVAAAKSWLGLTDDEIGIVKEKRCDYEGKKLVVGMVETLIQRKYPPEFYAYFGVVIGDEVHRLGAVEWSKAMPEFPAKWRVGVSATPKRKDGLDKVFKWTIGPVRARETEWYLKAQVFQIAWPVWVDPRKYSILKSNPVTGEEETEKTFLGSLIKILAGLPKYNEFLVEEIVKAAGAGRTILVLSAARAHLEGLKAGFDAATGGKYKSGFYWGGLGKKALADARTCQVLFGTYGKAKEGTDIATLDTLFFATPRADVEQDVGRILRLEEGKKAPLVVDVVHIGIGVAEDFAKKREMLYQRKRFEVKKVGKWPDAANAKDGQ